MASLPQLISVALFLLAAVCAAGSVAVLAVRKAAESMDHPPEYDDLLVAARLELLAISACLAVLSIVFALVAGVLL